MAKARRKQVRIDRKEAKRLAEAAAHDAGKVQEWERLLMQARQEGRDEAIMELTPLIMAARKLALAWAEDGDGEAEFNIPAYIIRDLKKSVLAIDPAIIPV